MNRRNFVSKSISFVSLIALHNSAQRSFAALNSSELAKSQGTTRFPHVTLYTSKLKQMCSFYTKDLGLLLNENNKDSFTVKIGDSLLEFVQAQEGQNPTYHYAINIPTNKFEAGKKWLSKRTKLLTDAEGNDEIYFEGWDAHATYFKDPCGNIGEFIARHTLDNAAAGNFALKDLLYLSEIGVPVDDTTMLNADLKASFGLEKYLNSSMFVGDEYGLFVIPPIGRLWIPEKVLPAESHPAEITIPERENSPFNSSKYSFSIKGS